MPVPDPAPAFTPPGLMRDLASLRDLAQMACCRHCFVEPHQPCNGAGDGRLGGVHLARFARAARCGLIRGPEFSLVLALAGDTFTSGTVIGCGDPKNALNAGRPPRPTVHQQVSGDRGEAGR